VVRFDAADARREIGAEMSPEEWSEFARLTYQA